MTAQYLTDPLAHSRDAVEAAREHVVSTALTAGPTGTVGLELEFHLVDLARPVRRPEWPGVQALVAGLPAMPSGSSVTVEPGAQLELSTPPAAGVGPAVAALRRDRAVLRDSLAAAGFGTAPIGADPARPARRINPGGRYAAMEQHFAALGCAGPGRAMMTATAALQVNLDAGPAAAWDRRLDLLRSLGPVLVAMSASSPYLAGETSGWSSMRQEAWHGIDHRRSDPVPGGEPGAAWADYALSAPVMLVRNGPRVTPVTERVPFTAWLRGEGPVDRRPTLVDLEYHLTTLFPPIRPRGYLEIRCLDALPDRWWPAAAAVTATLVEDELAADAARDACVVTRDRWTAAARAGLADPALGAAARRCVEIAARRCPPELKAEVEAFAELISRGRSPGDELRGRAEVAGPLAVLEEEARA
jgi:glutamate--cysteine ligase